MDIETRDLVLAGIAVAVDVVVRVLAVISVPRNRRPQTALAWLLAIFFLPYVGIILFLIVGSSKLPRARRRKQDQITRYIELASADVESIPGGTDIPRWLAPIASLNRSLGGFPLVDGNAATIYPTDDDAMQAMIRAMDAAGRSLNVEFYIMALDHTSEPFFDALARAVDRGVTVRVLLDHLGSSGYPGYRAACRRLDEMGAQWQLMLPFRPLRGQIQRPDLRNHRKLLVADGQVAFTGSRNIIDPGYQKRKNTRRGLVWKDFMVRFEGPIAAEINAIFATDWYSETDTLIDAEAIPQRLPDGELACQVVPSGPGFRGENNLRLFNSLVYAARKQIILTSPYFVPDDSMLYAITTAAQSGVSVELFVSEIGDQFLVYHAQRSYYDALLRAGVKIWLYEGPTILHAKHFTIDDEVSVIGSSNMDMRSFTLDLEISVMVQGGDFMAGMRKIQDGYRAHCRELTLEEWGKRGFVRRTLDDIARLTAVVQ